MKSAHKNNKFKILALSFLAFIIIYYVLIRNFLIPRINTVPIDLLIAGVVIINFIFASLSLTVTILRTLIVKIREKNNEKSGNLTSRLTSRFKYAVISILGIIAITIVSQVSAYTPPILNANGHTLENSIAEIKKVSVNDSDQYITVRGHDKNNPVILFLAGGPGGTQLAATRDVLSDLEKNFVVVNWDQPGSAKSFSAVPINQLSPERYIKDAHKLTQYLKERFNQDKIYIVGQSWGSALGIWLAEKYPEDYHAYIGSGQMVSFLDTEIDCYNRALRIAKENGDQETVDKLKAQGEPPYDSNVALQSATYLTYLFQDMASNPNIHHTSHNTFKDIAGPEYGLLDKVNYFRALIKTFDHVYPQLYNIDLRNSAIEFEIPIYILHGRYDVNAPTSFVIDYFNSIESPKKELVWFEHSGHDNWIDESKLFIEEIIRINKDIN